MANKFIQVQVVYASIKKQQLITLSIHEGSTIHDAINNSNILSLFPEIDLSRQKIGIFGKIKSLNTILEANDRVEIYRPLTIDPKEIRRLKAKKIIKKS